MTFKQFREWCSDRACDGCWGFNDALYCIELIQNMMKIPWWKREKTWKKIETQVICAVVTPINKKRQEIDAMMG
jgi:hypothetical protein